MKISFPLQQWEKFLILRVNMHKPAEAVLSPNTFLVGFIFHPGFKGVIILSLLRLQGTESKKRNKLIVNIFLSINLKIIVTLKKILGGKKTSLFWGKVLNIALFSPQSSYVALNNIDTVNEDFIHHTLYL